MVIVVDKGETLNGTPYHFLQILKTDHTCPVCAGLN